MTEITKTIPAYNPADVNTLSGLNNVLQDKLSMQIECSIPAIVISYDRNTNRATVKPAITGVASQGQKVSKEPLINIPVFCMCGGGVVMSFPVKTGDTGWLIANDRNISIFKQNLEESAPNDYRKHSFIDGYFLPDKINNISIAEEDDGALVIQSLNTTTKITLKDDNINLVAKNVTLTATNNTINGTTTINGATTINSTLNVTSTITAPEVVINGITFTEHVHSNGNEGNDTGVPK